MKTLFLSLAIATLAFTSCSKDENSTPDVGQTKETYIDATSKSMWHYYSFAEDKIVGSGQMDNDEWLARKDWDIAVNRYSIRTNGGVHTFASEVSFASVLSLPTDAKFVSDKSVTAQGMGGVTTTTVKSAATVILFKLNDDGSQIMPPVYLQAPVYIFRTADQKSYFKVQFTQYQDANKVSGHVKFYSAQIQ